MTLTETLKYMNAVRTVGATTFASRKQWQRLREHRLRALLKTACSYSRFYAERYRDLDVERCDVDALPPVTKAELLEHLQDVWTHPNLDAGEMRDALADPSGVGAWYQSRYCIYQTSGTQGQSLPIVQDRDTMRTVFAINAARSAANRHLSFLDGIRRLREPTRIAAITFKVGFYPSRAALSLLPSIAGRLVDLQHFSSSEVGLVERVHSFRPHAIFGYASVLGAVSPEAGPLDWGPLEHISNSSEQLTPAIRAKIEAAFRVPVHDHYGTGECLQLADTCEFGAMHVNADWVILESVDRDLKRVPDGVPGERTLVTNLANRVQPFIRYVVEDRLQLRNDTICRCGSTMPILEKIFGRTSDQIHVRDAAGTSRLIPGVLFQGVMEEITGIDEWRVVQRAWDQLEFEVQLAGGAARGLDSTDDPARALGLRIATLMQRDGVPTNVQVRVALKEHLPNDPRTGKFRRYVALSVEKD